MAERNPTQDKKLTSGDIRLLKRNGISPHVVKGYQAGLDLFKDGEGNVYVKPRDGTGPGEPTGLNLKALE